MRPFSNTFGDEAELWGGPFTDRRVVKQGQPFAQEYAFGIEFFQGLEMEKIAAIPEMPSPIANLEQQDLLSTMVGPPYILKGYDLWRVINKWAEFAPYVYDQVSDCTVQGIPLCASVPCLMICMLILAP